MLFLSLFNIRSVFTTFFSLNRLKFCLKWVKEVWDDLATDGIVSKAQELGMSADPGPEIPGYVETEFEDVQPNGPMVEYRDSELVEDLTEE